jgi:hypothetical protein
MVIVPLVVMLWQACPSPYGWICAICPKLLCDIKLAIEFS